MQVILQEDYPSLGFVGDLVKVKEGFARNYLFPKKIALPANPGNIKQLEHRKRLLEVKKSAKKDIAEKFRVKVEEVKVTIKHAAGDGERLFGSVTVADIAEELKIKGIEIDRKLIKLESPIKILGEHTVEIKLHQEVSAKINITIERTEEKKTKAGKESKAVGKKEKKPKKEAMKKEEKKDEKKDATEKTETQEAGEVKAKTKE